MFEVGKTYLNGFGDEVEILKSGVNYEDYEYVGLLTYKNGEKSIFFYGPKGEFTLGHLSLKDLVKPKIKDVRYLYYYISKLNNKIYCSININEITPEELFGAYNISNYELLKVVKLETEFEL